MCVCVCVPLIVELRVGTIVIAILRCYWRILQACGKAVSMDLEEVISDCMAYFRGVYGLKIKSVQMFGWLRIRRSGFSFFVAGKITQGYVFKCLRMLRKCVFGWALRSQASEKAEALSFQVSH